MISPICFFGVANPAGVEPATHGLEGLANLQDPMLNNDIHRVGLRCSSKHRIGRSWVESYVGFVASAGIGKGTRQARIIKYSVHSPSKRRLYYSVQLETSSLGRSWNIFSRLRVCKHFKIKRFNSALVVGSGLVSWSSKWSFSDI